MFELTNAFNNFIHTPKIKKIFTNPLTIAVLLTLVITAIIYINFRDASDLGFKLLRIGVYTIFFTTICLVLYNRSVEAKFRDICSDRAVEDTVDNTITAKKDVPYTYVVPPAAQVVSAAPAIVSTVTPVQTNSVAASTVGAMIPPPMPPTAYAIQAAPVPSAIPVPPVPPPYIQRA